MEIKLTNDGRNMLLNFVAGNKIKFTKAVFGNGDYRLAEGDKELPRIINPLQSCEFDSTPEIKTEQSVAQSVAKLSATFNNKKVESGFHVTEVGYYAKLVTKNGSGEDVEGDEALYAIGNANSSEADYVPSKNERLVEVTYDGLVYIGDADVSAVLSENSQYTLQKDFNAHIRDKNNPHEVSKEQVGLSEVPNVSTNDQTPTYADTDTLETLKSGEKLSVAFPKIKLAITKLIEHIGTKKGNPHNVTIKDVGGAAEKHYHNASDINSGVLSVERGGTGLSKGADFTVKATRPGNGSSSSGDCFGYTILPNGLLLQWGHANVDGHTYTINFAKEFANTNYSLIFPSCGEDFIPVWKNPEKYTTGFKLIRTFGADSAGLKKVLKAIFFLVDESRIDELFGASQACDWFAIGQAKGD